MRMEQYLECIDYTLWEIVENGNAPITSSIEVIEQTYERLQKLISQLGACKFISQEIHQSEVLEEVCHKKWTMQTIGVEEHTRD
ncbi:hypothetical protein Tco_0526099 [Tanacetum coccineum]